MSKHASPTVVGAFVIAGLALALIGVIVFGGGRLFNDTARMIVYFDGSVGGLRPGAPVKFRGIEIGAVQDVRINMSSALVDPGNIRIPVVLEIDVDRVTEQGVKGVDLGDHADVKALVDHGLRAQLATESMVTGKRYISLDIRPNTPAVLVGDPNMPYPEIPSVRGSFDQAQEKATGILDKLANVDIEKLANTLQATADDAHRLFASPHLERTLKRLDQLTASLNQTASDLGKTTRSLPPLVASAQKLVAGDGSLSRSIDGALREVATAARSVRRLADQLGRDPGAIVRGGRP